MIAPVWTIRAAEEDNDVPQKLNPRAEDNLEERGWKKASPKKMFKWTEEIRSDVSELPALPSPGRI